jgi:hypothetical protein
VEPNSGGVHQILLSSKNPIFKISSGLIHLDIELAVRKPDAGDYVFNSQKSIQLNRVTVFKIYREIARKAGLGDTLQHRTC